MQSSTQSGKDGTKIPSIIRSRAVGGPRTLLDTHVEKFSPKRVSLTKDKTEEVIEKLGRDLHLGLRLADGEKSEDRLIVDPGKQLHILPSNSLRSLRGTFSRTMTFIYKNNDFSHVSF